MKLTLILFIVFGIINSTFTTSPCKQYDLSLVCNYDNDTFINYINFQDWPGVDTVYIHHGKDIKLNNTYCIDLHLYNTSAIFIDTVPINTSCSHRSIRLQNSCVNKIDGKIKELDIYYSKVGQLKNIEGLEWGFIMNSIISWFEIRNLEEVDFKILDSKIKYMKKVNISYGASLNFVDSNISMAINNQMVVLNGGSLTLHKSRLMSIQNTKPVVVYKGGSFSIFSSIKPFTFFYPMKIDKVVTSQEIITEDYTNDQKMLIEDYNKKILQVEYDYQKMPEDSISTSNIPFPNILLIVMCFILN